MQEERKKQGQMPCPLCKGMKINGFAVCAAHKAAYNKEAAAILYEDGTPPTYEEWLIQKLEEAIPGLETEVAVTTAGHKTSAELYGRLLENKMLEKKKGQTVDPEVSRLLRITIEEKDGPQLRKESGEPTAFYSRRIAEVRLQEARRLLKELSEKTS